MQDLLLKPVPADLPRGDRRRRKVRRYRVAEVAPRFEGAYSFLVTNLESEKTYSTDLFAAHEGYRARCTCKAYVFGGAVCVHARKCLTYVAARTRAERRRLTRELAMPYDIFLRATCLFDDADARQLYTEHLCGLLPVEETSPDVSTPAC